tara:strand:+ start:844 stop:1050 length:207 start_codon:yes stop_codon:yes gene_type:complete
MGVVNLSGDYSTTTPVKSSIAFGAPHLVAAHDLVNVYATVGTRLTVLLNGFSALYVILVTNVFFALYF